MGRAGYGVAGVALAFSAAAALVLSYETAMGAPGLDYGKLGPLSAQDIRDFVDSDPKIATRPADKTLALFRYQAAHPPKGGTFDHPVSADDILQHEQYVRALFYSAAQRAPQTITSNDWKLVRADEKDLMESICENLGSPGAPSYGLTERDCAAITGH